MRVQAKSNQTGTLYELPLIAVALMIAGVTLGPKHAIFFSLFFLGLAVLFLPYILHFVFAVWNRFRLYRVLSGLRRSGFVVRYLLIGTGATNAVAFDTLAGDAVWIDIDGSSSEKIAGIEAVQLLTESWTKLGGPTRTVYTIRFTHNGKNTDFQQYGLRRARWKMRKLKKHLTGTTVVSEK